ncbi:MAG: disulfide bond formation protein DsbA, partial [Gammaproteobacteria bacterium]|nr:disulfide bond formation protein DsbA [Gammaproteobacteria bacterium]
MDMTRTLQIEIVSDFVCPWCYIGKKRLEKALDSVPDVKAEIVWRPFQLSPDMPREGRNRLEHYQQIFGAERAGQIMRNMQVTG